MVQLLQVSVPVRWCNYYKILGLFSCSIHSGLCTLLLPLVLCSFVIGCSKATSTLSVASSPVRVSISDSCPHCLEHNIDILTATGERNFELFVPMIPVWLGGGGMGGGDGGQYKGSPLLTSLFK